jgi:FkbM family methyltransferase
MNKIQLAIKARKTFSNWQTLIGVYFKTIKKENIILETKNNIKIKIRTNSTDIMQLGTVWLAQDYEVPGFSIKKEDIVIDIGAHIGLFSLFASQYCKNGKIFSYEPIEKNYNILKENINLNQIKNIIPFNFAVSNQLNKLKIFIDSNDDSAHSILNSGKNFIEVNSITIESIFDQNKIEKCNLLKLDCEGAEYQIIESIPKEYFSKIEKMIIEYHFASENLKLYKKLIQNLKNNFFKIKIEKISDDIGMIYAVNTKNNK